MAATIKSYSIGEQDTESKKMVDRLLEYTEKEGISMSKLILKALNKYEKNYLIPKTSGR